MAGAAVIEVDHLHKTYGRTVAVEDVSLRIEEGEIFGILGPNGAGKTTTVEAMVGLTPVDGGRIRVLGLDPHRDTARVRELVGIQLQEVRLPSRLRVSEALELYASFYAAPAGTDDLMDLLDLTEQRRTAFADLSGGQQQRLSIALALVGNPRIAVLDELTTGLDPHARRTTWELIEQIRRRGVTIVLVTHHMDEAEHLCDHLAVINHGRVQATGRPRELVSGDSATTYLIGLSHTDAQARAPYVAAALGTHVRMGRGRLEVTGGPRELTAALTALVDAGVVPAGIRTRSLDDAFVDLTRDP